MGTRLYENERQTYRRGPLLDYNTWMRPGVKGMRGLTGTYYRVNGASSALQSPCKHVGFIEDPL